VRLLAPVRLSRDTDATTSPESQRASISDYAEDHGHTVIWTDVEDRNVSGAVPIRERPGLGPWLEPGRIGTWDALCGHEMDRISRDMLDYLIFARDMTALGKIVIDVSDGTDTSTQRGRQILEDRILAAQRERERMSGRRQKAQARLRKSARWGGGVPPYPYRPVPLDVAPSGRAAGWQLVPDEAAKAVTRRAALAVTGGRAVSSLVVELNKAGTPAPRGGAWTASTLRKILRSDILRGYVLHYPPRQPGQPRPAPVVVLGEDGEPIRREAILTDQEFRELQAALDRLAVPATARRANPSLLLQVAFCGSCWRVLYRVTYRGYAYYRCAAKGAVHAGTGPRCAESRLIPAEVLEDAAARLFLDIVGRESEIVARVPVPGEDHSAEIATIDENIARLDDEYESGQLAPRAYSRMVSRLEQRREVLAALPVRLPTVRDRPTGETFGKRWDRSDTAGRQALMREATFRLAAERDSDGTVYVTALADEDLARRAVAAAGGQRQAPGPLVTPDMPGSMGYPLRGLTIPPDGTPAAMVLIDPVALLASALQASQ
jgi:DNA invertase Pin-like site-specific DNA recombinase